MVLDKIWKSIQTCSVYFKESKMIYILETFSLWKAMRDSLNWGECIEIVYSFVFSVTCYGDFTAPPPRNHSGWRNVCSHLCGCKHVSGQRHGWTYVCIVLCLYVCICVFMHARISGIYTHRFTHSLHYISCWTCRECSSRLRNHTKWFDSFWSWGNCSNKLFKNLSKIVRKIS